MARKDAPSEGSGDEGASKSGSRPPWERLEALNLKTLDEVDDDLTKKIVKSNVELEDELATRENLIRLFKVSQVIIKNAQEDLDAALDESEEKIKALEAKLEEAEEERRQEVNKLENEIEDLKEGGGGGGGGGGGDDEDDDESKATRGQLAKQVAKWKSEAESRKEALEEAKEEQKELEAKNKEQEGKIKQLEKDVKRYKEEIKGYDERLQAARSRANMKEQDQSRAQSQITEKNRQLQKVTADFTALSKRNEELETDLRLLTEELDAVDQEWKRAEAELKEEVKMREEAEANTSLMQKQIESLQNQVADIENQARSAGKATEKQLEESKMSLSALKRELVDREAELRKRDDLIGSLRQELNAMQNEAGLKYIVDQLQEKIGTKEERIKELELQLEDANSELEQLSEALVKVHDDARAGNMKELEQQTKELEAQRKAAAERNRERDEAIESAGRLVQELQERNEQIVQLRARMSLYEQGVYGLTEAVREIKELKGKIQVRDQDIANLTKQANEQMRKLEDFHDENLVLRDRCGMSPDEGVSLAPIRLAQQVELQQLRATNLQYMREIQALEEERMELKAELRLSALHRGERAVRLGLDVEDLEALEGYAEQLRDGKADGKRPRPSLAGFGGVPDEVLNELRAELKELRSQLQLERERSATAMIEKNEVLEAALPKLRRENAAMRAKYESLINEVVQFMEDPSVRANVLAGQVGGSGSLPQTPGSSLGGTGEGILSPGGPQGITASLMQASQSAAMLTGFTSSQAPMLTGSAPAIASPASPIGLQGRFERLYKQLQQREQADRHQESELMQRIADEKTEVTKEKLQMQEELAKASNELRLQVQQNKELRERMQQLAAHVTPSIPLPDELAKTAAGGRAAAEALAALNSQLVQCLDELMQREQQAAGMERELRRYRNRFDEVMRQQQVLYHEHVGAKKQLQAAERENKALKAHVEECERNVKELSASLARLQPPGEGETVRERVTDLTLKLVALQSTEGNATRKLAILEMEEAILRRENGRMTADVVEMERVLMTRVSDLQRAKDLAEQRATRLQTELKNSVSSEDYQHLHRQHEIAMERLRSAIEETAGLAGARAELEAAVKERDLLQIEVDKLKVAELGAREMEVKFKHLVDSLTTPSSSTDPKTEAAIAMAKLSESNAVREAKLAAKRCEQALALQKDLERQTSELHEQAIEVTKKWKDADADRMSLQKRLDGTIPREQAKALQERLSQAERDLEKAQSEVARFRDLSHIAERQSRQLAAMLAARNDQLGELHAALRSAAAGADDKAKVGKLHYQLLQLRLGEAASRRAEEQARAQVAQLNTVLRRVEQRSDEAVATMYRARDDYRQQIAAERQAKEDAQLRTRQTISMKRFEALKNSLVASERKRVDLQLRANHIGDELHRVQDEMDATSSQVQTLRELVDTLKGGTAGDVATRLSEWSSRVQSARSMEGKLMRQAARLQDKVKNLEADNGRMEAELSAFEEKCVRLEEQDEKARVQFEVQVADLNRRLKKTEDELQLAQQSEAPRAGIAGPALSILETGAAGNERLQSVLDAARRMHEPTGASELIQQLSDMQADFLQVQRELQQAQSQLAERELMMTELQGRLRLQSLPALTGGEGAVPHPRVGIGAGDVDLRASEELTGFLSGVADETIRRLQAEVQAQRALVQKYQTQLQALRDQFAAQKKVDKVQVEKLADEIFTEGDREVQKMRQALKVAEENEKNALSPVLLADEVDELLHERDTRILHLQALLDTAQRRGATLEEQLAQRGEELAMLQRKMEDMQANDPSKALQRQLTLLRTKLAGKEQEQYKLQAAIKELKQEMLVAADEKFEEITKSGAGAAQAGDVQAATAELQQRFASVQARMLRAKGDVDRVKEANEKLSAEVRGLKEQTRTLQATVERQADELVRARKALGDAELTRKKLQAQLDANPRAEALERRLHVMEKYRKEPAPPGTPTVKLPGTPDTPRETSAPPPASAPASGSGLKSQRDIRPPPKPSSPPTAAEPAAQHPPALARISATREAAPDTARGAETARGAQTAWGAETARGAQTARSEAKPAGPVERWHAEKRLQKQVDMLKEQLETKTKQYGVAQQQLARAKELIEKLERAGPGARGAPAPHPAGEAADQPELRWDVLRRIQNAEEARDELAATQQELENLRRVLRVEKEAEVRRLVQRVRELEAALERAAPPNKPGARAADAESEAVLRAEIAERRVQELESEAVERDAANVELRFDRESLALSVQRLQRRVTELQAYNQALAAMGGRKPGGKEDARDAAIDKESTPLAAARRRAAAAAGEKKVAELESVVEAMKKVVERVQGENEALKRAVPTNVRYMELLKENKQLRQQLSESSAAGRDKGGAEDARQALNRTVAQLASVQRQLKKEQETSERRRQAVEHLTEERNRMEAEVRALREGSADPKTQRVLEESLIALQGQCRRLQQDADEQRVKVKTLKEKLVAAQEVLKDVRGQLEEREREVVQLHQQVREQEDRRREAEADAQRWRKQASREVAGTAPREEAAAREEARALRAENAALKGELAHFDGAFFEEIEELKFRYAEAERLARRYELLCRDYSARLGLDFPPRSPQR